MFDTLELLTGCGLGLKLLNNGLAHTFQRCGLAGLDGGHLNDGKADAGLHRIRHTRLGQAEHGGPHGGIGHGRLRGFGIGRGLDARILTGLQGRRDPLGGLGVRGRVDGEGPTLGNGQGVLAELEALHDGLFTDFRRLSGGIVEQHDRGDPGFGTAQLGLVLVHESGQLGIGRSGRGAGHLLGDGEPATIPAFQRAVGNHGAIDAGHPGARIQRGAEVVLGILVGQVPLQVGRGHVLALQDGSIGLFVKLAGDLVEEGRDLTNLLEDQFLARANAHAAGPVLEGQFLRLALQVSDVDVLPDQLLNGDRSAGLFLIVLADLLEIRDEFLLGHAAVAGLDHVARPQRGEDVRFVADDQKADGDQTDNGNRPGRFGEVAEVGDHDKPWAVRRCPRGALSAYRGSTPLAARHRLGASAICS